MKDLLVRDWMTRKVITVDGRTTLPVAERLMKTNGIRRLPVVDGGRLAGIVTRSDVREASPSGATSLSIWELNYLLSKLEVSQIMTKNVITVSPNSTIRDAAKLMFDRKIGGLPVVDASGGLLGIITESDIFRVLIAWFDEQEGE